MSSITYPTPVARNGVLSLAQDYAELFKARVTSLIVMTAWCGFYFGALRSGASSLSWGLLHALLGIGLVAGGTAGLNEVIEHEDDALMRRTERRPLPAKRMGMRHATIVTILATCIGVVYLALACNLLTGLLALATSAAYLGLYTPLKKISPLCTFVGAFPGAMPGVLGWTAARGRLEWEALVLFAIVFFWQFPHFHSIAWLYREDYERAQIRMLPVVHADGRSTVRAIVLYSLGLIPVSMAPTFLHMAGRIYFIAALLLGIGFLWMGLRLGRMRLAATAPRSKAPARHVLIASVVYLPILFAVMMLNPAM
ncbi:MAG: heme o synthase [Acidobacteriia bacterium]|nr:heme o synthase [Terriglobia bacterium]